MAQERLLEYNIYDNFRRQPEDIFFGTEISSPNQILLGATLRTATAFGRSATVKAGEDIRPAINSLKSAGGGTLILLAGTHVVDYDIVGSSKISIVGVGQDQTIIEFNGGAYGIKYIGTVSSIIESFEIKNLTIQNSNTTAGLDIDYCDYFNIENIKVTSCDQSGIRVKHSQYFRIENVSSDNNTSKGYIFLGGESTRPTNYFTLINLLANSNTDDGFDFDQDDASGTGTAYGTVINCRSVSNGGKGFEIDACSLRFINCDATSNTGDGFEMERDFSSFISCSAIQNGAFGFQTLNASDTISIVDSFIDSNTSGDFDLPTGSQTNVSVVSAVSGSTYINTTERDIRKMQNTSGGALTAGDVVTIKSTTDGEQITTTTTQGDSKVYGVALNAASSNGLVIVLRAGLTTLLRVNGTDDIAVGDYLSTYSSAGIAAKARKGDQVFAIALEAYSTNDSSGVIDAYILPYKFPLVSNDDLIGRSQTLDIDAAAVGNVGTGYDDLITYDIAANTFANVGDTLRVRAWGTIANTAASKELRFNFGSNVILNYTSFTTSAASSWHIDVTIVKTATDTFDTVVCLVDQNGQTVAVNDGITQDDASTITIKGVGAGTNDDDITQNGMVTEFLTTS